MIVVKITQTGLTVDGHAGYAKTGNDIICAAVSALAQGLIHSLEALTDDKIAYQIKDGHIDIEYENLSGQGKLLIDSFFIAISDIQLTYGKEYVQMQAQSLTDAQAIMIKAIYLYPAWSPHGEDIQKIK